MVIGAQGFGQAALLHHDETGAVNKSPIFV
jgi:hypothetical protein